MWTGKVRLNEEFLKQPIEMARPSEIAVCTMSDLFQENIPTEWIDAVFDIIDRTPWHVYQILTKRAERMLAYTTERRPPRNACFGVSAERQEEADARIPLLLQAAVGVRFIVFYPVLAAINLRRALGADYHQGAVTIALIGDEAERPMKPTWARRLRRDCAALGIQTGEAKPSPIAVAA